MNHKNNQTGCAKGIQKEWPQLNKCKILHLKTQIEYMS